MKTEIKKWSKYFVFLILVVGFYLRLFQVGQIPPSFSWDEAATGFDAYSILITGKDQFGNFLPLSFRSLDDYKPPVYTYLTVVAIKFLGWNDFAVRFPSVFLGTLSILGTYLLIEELFKNRKLALLASVILAISPWHMHFSRLALESNNVIFFTTFGVYFFFKGLKNTKVLPLAVLFFGLGMFTYHSARFVIPMIFLVLIILNLYKISFKGWGSWLSILMCLILMWMIFYTATSVSGQMRFRGASIFTQAQSLQISQEKAMFDSWQKTDSQQGNRLGSIWHGRTIFYSLMFIKNYFKHLDPNFWLFSDNDTLRHHVAGMGIIYFIELPLILCGAYFLVATKKRHNVFLIFTWLAASIVPSALTRDVPHAMRIAVMMPMPQILIALGLYYLTRIFPTFSWRRFWVLTVSTLYLLNNAFFLHQYFIHYSQDSAKDWRYGRREAAKFAEAHKSKYDKIIVSTNLEFPHVFFLYYLKYDPVKYLSEGGTVSGGWGEVTNKFDKYYFQPFDYGKEKHNNYLFIGKPEEFAKELIPLKKIKYLNGEDAIWIVEGKATSP